MEFDVYFWKDLVDKMLAGVFIADDTLNHLYTNEIFCIATGYSNDELKKMTVFDLVYKDDTEKVEKYIERVRKGEVVLDEIRYVTKDGRVRWVYGLFRPFVYKDRQYAIGNYVDITKAKRLEEMLKEREEFYRVLVDKSFAGICIIQKGKLVFFNQSFARGMGYTEEEMKNIDVFQVIHPEDRERVYNNYLKREAGLREDERAVYWKIIRKDGKIRWITARATRIMYKGEPAVYVTTLDTTDLQETNEELSRKNEFLSLLSKMLRHDILNDLAVIRGAIEVKEDAMLEMALSRIDKIVEKINDIKNLEEAMGKLRPMNVAEVIRWAVDKYAEQAVFKLSIQDVFVEANEALKSAIENIINNAILHSQVSPVEITINVFKERDECIIEIADNGVGIPNEIKEKIFEAGYSRRGGGLGLYLVKKIVEMFGGKVSVRDNVPKGALFEIRLPLRPQIEVKE
ncbi:MAG: PAS domain-containing sensor histidine kinase [Archaeoglobaceae archaeon]